MKQRLTFLMLAAGLLLFSCQSKPTAAEPPAEPSQLEEEHKLFRAGYADSVNNGLIADTSFKGSARREAKGKIGASEIAVNYGSPGKRGRVLWNGLVAYDQIWVSGSHWATAVTFSQPVTIQGTSVPAGTYGFFTIPGIENWTLILNKEYDMHLAEEYKPENDVVRLTVTPEAMNETVQRLTYTVRETEPGKGDLALSWDQLRVSVPIEAEKE